ncbi:MAG TPA: BlaI/MecI/CopY family transcriptional regulator [Phycisphaerae bacterium]|nr:BlaI/MecI/CopY family transcriptional regulator [Phycisphaerae bacterium]
MPPSRRDAVPSISEAEWEVMRVIWDDHPATASDVVDRLEGRRDWSPRTVKTLLNRLVSKAALAYEADGKRYLYSPAVGRDECVRAESQSFLHRVFEGSAGPMLVHFVRSTRLSPAEIATLRKVLDEKQEG